jgi:hypothetical protein
MAHPREAPVRFAVTAAAIPTRQVGLLPSRRRSFAINQTPRIPTDVCDSEPLWVLLFLGSWENRNSSESHMPVGFRGLGGLMCSVDAKLEVEVVETCSVDPGQRQYHAAPRRVLEP